MIPSPPPEPRNLPPPPIKKVPAALEAWLASSVGVLTILYLHDARPAGPHSVQDILPQAGMEDLPRGYRLLLAKLDLLVKYDLCEIRWIDGAKCFRLSPAGVARVPAARDRARTLQLLLASHLGE